MQNLNQNSTISDAIIRKEHVFISFSTLEKGHYLLPENYGEILINLGSSFTRKLIGSLKVHEIESNSIYLFTCQNRGSKLISDGNVEYISIKIHPAFINSFLNENDILCRNSSRRILENYQAFCIDEEDRLMFILDSKKQSYKVDNLLLDAIEEIHSNNGDIKVNDLLLYLSVSKSTLEQKFSNYIYTTPKEYCKIEKLKQFLKNFNMYQGSMNLTQLTFKSGYYDQSHLIKEFHYFMDMKPTNYLNTLKKAG